MEKISAIIVTYNADPQTVGQSLERLTPQVGEVFIVDNASQNRELLKPVVAQFPQARLIENDSNAGMAVALNIGVREALRKGTDWILTLDDDSLIPAGMIESMLQVYRALPFEKQQRIGILAPNYRLVKGVVYPLSEPREVPTAIASGQLIKAAAFKVVAGYREDLFIDGFDHEFCFHLKTKGLMVLLIPNVIFEQRIGQPELHQFLGRKFVVSHHQPHRYYYIFRNSIFLYRHYWRSVPGWMWRNMIMNGFIVAKIIFFEENKWTKIRFIIHGLFDGFRGQLGRLPAMTTKR